MTHWSSSRRAWVPGAIHRVIWSTRNFARRTQKPVEPSSVELSVAQIQRCAPAHPLDEILGDSARHGEAIVTVYSCGVYSYRQISKIWDVILRRFVESLGAKCSLERPVPLHCSASPSQQRHQRLHRVGIQSIEPIEAFQ